MNVRCASPWILALCCLALAAMPLAAQAAEDAAASAAPNRLVIHADQGKNTINRNIYGHFSEHLGRCIYEGIWVGEDSPIPNTRGIRNDVVAALQTDQDPRPALAGRLLCRRVPLEGRHRPARRNARP